MPASLLRLGNAVQCTIIERVNRFVVAVDIDGRRQQAWINNTGRLTGFMQPGLKAYCLPREEGKTDTRLFAVADGDTAALIDTRLQMMPSAGCPAPFSALARRLRLREAGCVAR